MTQTPSLGLPADPARPPAAAAAPPPAPPPRGPVLPQPDRADGPRAVAIAIAAALLAAAIGPVTVPTLGMAVVLSTLPLSVLARPDRRSATVTGVLVVAAALPLLAVVRADVDVAGVVALSTLALTAIAATSVRGGDPLSLGGRAGLRRLGLATGHAALGPTFVGRAATEALSQRGRVTASTRGAAQGLLLAVPLVVIMSVLLASGDAVFAQVVRLPTIDGLGGRVALGLGVGCLVSGALRAAASRSGQDPAAPRRRVGSAQAMGLLVPVCALFVLFVSVQVVTAAGGAGHVIEAAGLTHAEYAREGFFQLLAVAAITLGVLVAVRVWVRTDSRGRIPAPVRLVAVLSAGLVVVIVAVAVIRLDLYIDAFGLTRLRLWSTLASVWIGGSFLAVIVRLQGWRTDASWLLPVTVAWGLALVVAIGLAGPDHVIVRRNVELAAAGGTFDVGYALSLSDDAVPALLEGRSRLSADDAAVLEGALCARPAAQDSLWAFNAAVRRADQALSRLDCPGI